MWVRAEGWPAHRSLLDSDGCCHRPTERVDKVQRILVAPAGATAASSSTTPSPIRHFVLHLPIEFIGRPRLGLLFAPVMAWVVFS